MTDPKELARSYIEHVDQLMILAEECPICGRSDVLFVPFGERVACVDCVTKENGEDGT